MPEPGDDAYDWAIRYPDGHREHLTPRWGDVAPVVPPHAAAAGAVLTWRRKAGPWEWEQ